MSEPLPSLDNLSPWVKYLLHKLGEECAEVGQEVHKALIFGPDDPHRGSADTPAKRLHREYNDVIAVAMELADAGFDLGLNSQALDAKRAKLRQYFEHAKARGFK